MNKLSAEYARAFLWQLNEFKGTDKELDGYMIFVGSDFADTPTDPQMPLDKFLSEYYPIYLHGGIKSLEKDMEIKKYRVHFYPTGKQAENGNSIVNMVNIIDDNDNLIYRCLSEMEWEWFLNFVLVPMNDAFTARGIPFDFIFFDDSESL